MFKELKLPGVFIIEDFKEHDIRGWFRKNFNKNSYNNLISNFEIRESYITSSKKFVIRGMHFQSPPNECSKLVTCINGAIIQILLDIRKGSNNYGNHITIKLDDKDNNSVFIPTGIAHGFISLFDKTTILYQTSREYSKKRDSGIKWNSFGFSWPAENELIISERDKNFDDFKIFKSPF